MIKRFAVALTACTLALLIGAPAAAAPPTPPLKSGDRYVALGDSYASGSGVAPLVDAACLRSQKDYPALLAQQLGLSLTDVTCSAATIDHMVDTSQLTPGNTLVPPQIDAVTTDTRLVTITAGGNDVNLFLDMVRYSCSNDPATVTNAPNLPIHLKILFCLPADPNASKQALAGVEAELVRLVEAVRRKAPAARIVLTDYVNVVPLTGAPCAQMPLTADQIAVVRQTQAQLSLAVERAANRTHATFVPAAVLGARHDACARAPWTNRFVFGDYAQIGVDAYHPNSRGNAAVADAIRDGL